VRLEKISYRISILLLHWLVCHDFTALANAISLETHQGGIVAMLGQVRAEGEVVLSDYVLRKIWQEKSKEGGKYGEGATDVELVLASLDRVCASSLADDGKDVRANEGTDFTTSCGKTVVLAPGNSLAVVLCITLGLLT
jgi:hypothetical protein